MEQTASQVSSDPGAGHQLQMKDWTVDLVCEWLVSLGRDESVVEDFRNQKICGFVLSRLEERHLEKMSSVKIGDILIILDKRNEILAAEANAALPSSLSSISNDVGNQIECSSAESLSPPKRQDTGPATIITESEMKFIEPNERLLNETDVEICDFQSDKGSIQNAAEIPSSTEKLSKLFHSHESDFDARTGCVKNDVQSVSLQQKTMSEHSQECLKSEDSLKDYTGRSQNHSESLDGGVEDMIIIESRTFYRNEKASEFVVSISKQEEQGDGIESTDRNCSQNYGAESKEIDLECMSVTEKYGTSAEGQIGDSISKSLEDNLVELTEFKEWADVSKSNIEESVTSTTIPGLPETEQVHYKIPAPVGTAQIETLPLPGLNVSNPRNEDSGIKTEKELTEKQQSVLLSSGVSSSGLLSSEGRNDDMPQRFEDISLKVDPIVETLTLLKPDKELTETVDYPTSKIGKDGQEDSNKTENDFGNASSSMDDKGVDDRRQLVSEEELDRTKGTIEPTLPRRFKSSKELLEFKRQQKEQQKSNKDSVNLLMPNVTKSLVKNLSKTDLDLRDFKLSHTTPRVSPSDNTADRLCDTKVCINVGLQVTPDSLSKSKEQVVVPPTTESNCPVHTSAESATKMEPLVKPGYQIVTQSLACQSTESKEEKLVDTCIHPSTLVTDKESKKKESRCQKSQQRKQPKRATSEKRPTDNSSTQMNIAVHTAEPENAPCPSPESVKTSEQKSVAQPSIKLIGKNVPQKVSRERIVHALTARETVEPKFEISEHLRTVGTSVGVEFKYKRGAKVLLNERFSESNFLHPVHHFVEMKGLNDAKSLTEWSREVLMFVCGCLNNRRNGTIHFGIVPESSSADADYGEIIGVQLTKGTKEYEDFLKKKFQTGFHESQIETALQCIKGPQFIETMSTVNSEEPKLFVIELDVILKHVICQERVFVVKLPTEREDHCEQEAMFRVVGGKPKKLLDHEETEFRKNVHHYAAERKKAEEQRKRKLRIENDLSKKFTLLFCHGEENLLGDHYQILVINRLDDNIDSSCIADTLSFISEIEWRVVFDFDPDATLCTFVQDQGKSVKINTTDDFDPHLKRNVQEPDRLKQLLDDMKTFDCMLWCFANGYQPLGDTSDSPLQWKRKRSIGFKEAVRFFNTQIPHGRATVVFLLLSKDYEVMLEAADELMTVFHDQWMCVAENEDIGTPWMGELVRRNCVELEASEDRVVWGMPWKHVQETVNRILGPKKCSPFVLPTSTGAFIPLHNKLNNEWTDLQILSSTECETAEIMHSDKLLEQHKMKVEEEFYKGDSVSWWNFWFRQVCARDILDFAKQQVQSALSSEEDAVGKIFIYHQPGAGGTTAAKNILWDFRKEYRCAMIQKISSNETAKQVLKFFWYEDKDPKPVILLLDNPDADKLNLLYADLCEMSRYIVKRNPESQRVICVLVVCSRFYHKVKGIDPKRLLLKHELSPIEINWFKDKYKYLTSEFNKKENSDLRPPNSVHPRLLFSFNVMKENFNRDYIRRTVKELVQFVSVSKERQLLKYVSLLNCYDLECRPIPTASLDGLMLDIPWLNQGGLRYGAKAKSNRWETKLSAEVRILLNETSETVMGKIHSLRIANPLLSREILNILRDNERIPVSEIAVEFFNCKEIFNALCVPRDNLVNIIKDVLKRRQQKGGRPDKAFSPLIQHIVDHESIDSAVDVMKQVLALTADPFIDQQLARLFIKAQNWDRATEYAKKATEQKPDNSFFWDTYGRIHEKQLGEEYDKLTKDTLPHSIGDLVHVIEIALNGMFVFQKVQETSEQEKTTIQANKAGFFGELQMVACLLDCLVYAFKDIGELREFILNHDYVPPDCRMLRDVDGHNYLVELKSLEKHVQRTMNRLEDELIQLRDDTLVEYQRMKYSVCEIDSLTRLKEHLDIYFGENNDKPPENLNEKQQCEFRRRRVFRLASHNIGRIFDLRWQPDGESSLTRIQKIAKKNLDTCHANAEDYLMMISVNLALTSMAVSSLYDSNIRFDEMVKWSNELYKLRETIGVIHLEPYLFYVMFNWPRKNTRHSIAPKLIETALRQWKDAYYVKYPRQQEEGKPYRKKDTTMFFLANGSDVASVYTTFEEKGSRRINENRGRDSFWRMPDTLRKLQRFDGVLSRDGNEVSVYLHYEQGNKAPITIPTSFPIQNREMWNKKVYFVIGFSWNGPRAFDLTLTDPTLNFDMATGHKILKPAAQTSLTFTRRPTHDYRQEDFSRQCSELRTDLEKIRKQLKKLNPDRKPTTKEEEMLREEKILMKRLDVLLKDRQRDMDSRIPDF